MKGNVKIASIVVVFIEQLGILANCYLSPMKRNSVLEKFKVKRLASSRKSYIVFYNIWVMFASRSAKKKEKLCVTYTEKDNTRVLKWVLKYAWIRV